MTPRNNRGLTLLELLIAITITGMITLAASALLSTTLRVHAYGTEKHDTYRDGKLAMNRMTRAVRSTTMVMIPNNHAPTRDILAVSDMTNDDNDFYFGDPLFPRIDEDTDRRFNWGSYGVGGYDDDGDGFTDEGLYDEDEDSIADEDPLDGIDNDGDGNVDEEVVRDMNADTFPGIEMMDDDGDGTVDEGSGGNARYDDDEDGVEDESVIAPIVYEFRSGPGELWEVWVDPNATGATLSETLLVSNVTAFATTFEAPERILITLTLTGDDGENVTFSEYTYVRNTYQRNGKRAK